MKKRLFLMGCIAFSLMGCSQLTTSNIDADIQEAAFISCLLSDGSQVFYAVSSQISNPQSKLVQNSNKIAQGSTALCSGLQKINTTLNSMQPQTSIPAANSSSITADATALPSTK